MKIILRSILFPMAILLALLPLTAPHPAAAQDEPVFEMDPGLYKGFVTLILHADVHMPVKGKGGTATVEYEGVWIQRTGLLELRVDPDYMGFSEVHLNPILAAMDYFDYIQTPVGDCTWGASWVGEMRHNEETVGIKFPGDDSFDTSMLYRNLRTSSFEMYEASGSLQGCDKRISNTIWKSLLIYAEDHSEDINKIYLKVTSRPNPGIVNGKCSVDKWDKSEPVAGGTFVRDTPACSWNAWRVSNDPSSSSFGSLWKNAIKRHGRK